MTSLQVGQSSLTKQINADRAPGKLCSPPPSSSSRNAGNADMANETMPQTNKNTVVGRKS